MNYKQFKEFVLNEFSKIHDDLKNINRQNISEIARDAFKNRAKLEKLLDISNIDEEMKKNRVIFKK
jgi:hypothetical protein